MKTNVQKLMTNVNFNIKKSMMNGLSKKLALLLLAGTTLATANAQIQFGLKAGANFASLTNTSGSKTLVGFNGGALVKIPLAGALSLQPEAVYSGQGIKGDGGSIHLNYINIPVLANYSLPIGVFFQTGPQLGFLMSAKLKADGESDIDLKPSLKSTDFSWAFGAGYLLPITNLGFNVRYNLGLTSLGKEGGTSKNGVFQVGVFYLFGETAKHK
ncbi:porin family protein [Flavitalea flava]